MNTQYDVENQKPLQQGVVAVIRDGDRFLTIKRSQTVRAPGKFCFPGGGVEDGESNEEALIREMQEELSIQVIPGRQVWNTARRGFELNWIVTEIAPDQTVTPNPDEVESFQWLTQIEIQELPYVLETNLEFFQALDRGEFSFD